MTLEVRFKVIGREVWSDEWEQRTAMDHRLNDATYNAAHAVRNTHYAARSPKSEIKNRKSEILAAGICGSGIIEAIAELFVAGVLTPDGRFAAEVRSPRLSWQGSKVEFVLAWPHEASTGRPIVVTSDDVRNIQLDKAALYSGARLLIDRKSVV